MKWTKSMAHLAIGPSVALLLRLVLGSVLIWSSLHKIQQPWLFLANVHDFRLVSEQVGILVAIVLPLLELAVGVCLVLRIFIGGALVGGVILGCIFVAVQASALWRGLTVACGCFSSAGYDIVGYATLLRASVFLAAIALMLGLCIWSAGNRSHSKSPVCNN